MVVRLVRCRCNYRLRFGATRCRYCFEPTPLINRWYVWVIAVAAVAAIVFYRFGLNA